MGVEDLSIDVDSKPVYSIVKMSCPISFIPCPQYLLLSLAHRATTCVLNEHFVSIGAGVGVGALRSLLFDSCHCQVCP